MYASNDRGAPPRPTTAQEKICLTRHCPRNRQKAIVFETTMLFAFQGHYLTFGAVPTGPSFGTIELLAL
jgi:hypothetical protein